MPKPSRISTLQCVKKAGVLWEKTRVFPKNCKRTQITNRETFHLGKEKNIHEGIQGGKEWQGGRGRGE